MTHGSPGNRAVDLCKNSYTFGLNPDRLLTWQGKFGPAVTPACSAAMTKLRRYDYRRRAAQIRNVANGISRPEDRCTLRYFAADLDELADAAELAEAASQAQLPRF